jgi:hypothetical protein
MLALYHEWVIRHEGLRGSKKALHLGMPFR